MEETQAGPSEMKRENSRSEGSAGAEDQQNNKDEGGKEGETSTTNSKVSRKRTKTGCLSKRSPHSSPLLNDYQNLTTHQPVENVESSVVRSDRYVATASNRSAPAKDTINLLSSSLD